MLQIGCVGPWVHAEADRDFRREPGKRRGVLSETPLDLGGRALHEVGVDRSHERLVRTLGPVRARTQRHTTSTAVHLEGHLGGEPRLSDPRVAPDHRNGRFRRRPLPACEEPRSLRFPADELPAPCYGVELRRKCFAQRPRRDARRGPVDELESVVGAEFVQQR
jgi:hypothetical protein